MRDCNIKMLKFQYNLVKITKFNNFLGSLMIEIIFLDVDGCLTDGGLYHSNSGEEMKKFNVKDGFGIQEWQKLGKKVAIITGKTSKIVENRAKELKIPMCFQGVKDKFEKAKEILKEHNLDFSQAGAIGDDFNDIKLLKNVKMAFAPKDALIDKKLCKNIIKLQNNGGNGAVREMIEFIIKKNKIRKTWLKTWL